MLPMSEDLGADITKVYLLNMLQDHPEEHPIFQAGLLVLEYFCDSDKDFADRIAKLRS